MSDFFSADEVFEMAQEIERKGAEFYRTAAGLAKKRVTADLLEEMARWETGHLEMFTALRTQYAKQDESVNESGETGEYLRALADSEIVDLQMDPAEVFTGDESMSEIVQMALKMEKESIIFYLGVKEMVSKPEDKEQVKQIITEEMRHIAFLSKELAGLQ
jgi:rubrerythrin